MAGRRPPPGGGAAHPTALRRIRAVFRQYPPCPCGRRRGRAGDRRRAAAAKVSDAAASARASGGGRADGLHAGDPGAYGASAQHDGGGGGCPPLRRTAEGVAARAQAPARLLSGGRNRVFRCIAAWIRRSSCLGRHRHSGRKALLRRPCGALTAPRDVPKPAHGLVGRSVPAGSRPRGGGAAG